MGSNQLQGRWYFGWNIVAACSILTLITVGTRLGIGPFVKPILDDLGMDRTELSVIIAIGMLVYGLGMPLAGRLLDSLGTRNVLLIGVGLVVLSIIWTYFSHDMLSFALAYGVLLSLGLSFTSPVTVTPVVSRWFTKQRGKALFYLSTGSMAGIAIMTPIFTLLIDLVGWRNTLLLLAVIFIVIAVPSAIFIIRDEVPEGGDALSGKSGGSSSNKGQEPRILSSWTEALKTRPFWQVAFGLFVCGFSMNLLGSHGVPMLTDHHFSNVTASFGVGIIGIVAMVSTVFLGSVSDRIPRRSMLSLIYFIRGLGFLGLVLVMTPWQLYLVATIGGLVWAGSAALSSAILGDVYGVRWVGILYGWAYFIHQIGGAMGSFLGGWSYEQFGTHLVSYSITTFLLVLASVVSFQIPSQLHLPKQQDLPLKATL
ncbi:MFS transporter [Ammoniphilus sp. CFH 90114]|uniref:MFS transporter n=1 Tax=Ammoniphilus sp. CFH 90114 TaxID=2493665 RepID=UPI00196A9E3D|nr:MFS transporter [Ammoniphilus sp. CFH 90114]